MTLDDILLEWSYRLPKGYPTMKDGQFDDSYTPSVRILFENQPKKSKKDQPKNTKSYE